MILYMYNETYRIVILFVIFNLNILLSQNLSDSYSNGNLWLGRLKSSTTLPIPASYWAQHCPEKKHVQFNFVIIQTLKRIITPHTRCTLASRSLNGLQETQNGLHETLTLFP